MKKLFLSIILSLLLATKLNVFADDVSRAHTFVDAEVLTAALLNGEFDPIVTALNDVTGAQLKSDIAITTSGAMAVSGTASFTGTFSATGTSINLGNGGSDVLTINAAGGITFTPAATWTFTGAQTVSGTWANLGTVTTGTFAALLASANLDIGSYDFKAQTLTSDVATGTAPLVVSSTTKVSNLNADYIDGYHVGTSPAATVVYVSGGDGYLPNAVVDTTALKTTSGEVSKSDSDFGQVTMPGGDYAFWPKVKMSTTSTSSNWSVTPCHAQANLAGWTSYAYNVSLNGGEAGYTIYATFTYVTASGEDMWIFLLIDKTTKEILCAYAAPDHPAYGNGGDFDKLPHPFLSYDQTKQEIVLLDKETCLTLKQESEQTGKSILTLVNEDYKPNINKEEAYQPLHSGKYKEELADGKINIVKQMVETIPDYIKVRKLERLTQQEKDQREIKYLQERQKKSQDKASAENKLKSLGLNEDEIIVLIK